ncbi:DUF742 domain-containing protein [Streptomyces yaizuensis]|uniref:DUF742 domain-containing protein n=1 Tax=Streptomyces yaizuensis TaxID=2989713 RepID=A0ABQ5P4E8_9ACTN|nr:DUF742 domain-containing protein [Streptomyces sp. YSPA8]
MTGRRGGRPLVPAYVSTGGRTRPSRNSLERLSVLTGLTTCPEDPAPGSASLCGAGPPPLPAPAAALATTAPAAAPPARPRPPAHAHPPDVPPDLPAAQRSLLGTLDGGSLTVVETAALLELPVSAVRVLAAHLIDLGLVNARPPIPHAAQPDPDLLERVADGLRALKL